MSTATQPIRVLRRPGHPISVPERHTRRPSPMWTGPPPLFPDWLPPQDIQAEFSFVERDPHVVTMTLSYHLTIDDLDRCRALRDSGVPLVVFYTLDDFHDPARGGWDRPPG
jgi:hypothetical protein